MEQVAVIPSTNKALSEVSTPFVSFETKFKSRPGRFERQLEATRRNAAVVLLADTWPDAYHDLIHWGLSKTMLEQFGAPQERYKRCIWPETAIYPTGIARMYKIDEEVKYRPQLHFFCQYYERCTDVLIKGYDVEISPEAAIYVEDRSIYPLEYPALTMRESDLPLTVVAVGDVEPPPCEDVIRIPKLPATGTSFNEAVCAARGEKIAIVAEGYTYCENRLQRQLEDAVDLSLGVIDVGDTQESWVPYRYSEVADRPTGQLATMMFSKDMFRAIGGAHPDISTGFGYDLFLRALTCDALTFAYHKTPLASGQPYVSPHGSLYTQHVYNDAANRLRYSVGYHHTAIRKPL